MDKENSWCNWRELSQTDETSKEERLKWKLENGIVDELTEFTQR